MLGVGGEGGRHDRATSAKHVCGISSGRFMGLMERGSLVCECGGELCTDDDAPLFTVHFFFVCIAFVPACSFII